MWHNGNPTWLTKPCLHPRRWALRPPSPLYLGSQYSEWINHAPCSNSYWGVSFLAHFCLFTCFSATGEPPPPPAATKEKTLQLGETGALVKRFSCQRGLTTSSKLHCHSSGAHRLQTEVYVLGEKMPPEGATDVQAEITFCKKSQISCMRNEETREPTVKSI